jgi:LDH2 family malate/lactate/ureidoglycolate dehydrogenase
MAVMTTMSILKVKALQAAIVARLVTDLRVDSDSAQATARHLIHAEQAGKPDHGLQRAEYLLNHFQPFEHASGPPVPTVPSPGRVLVDGTGYLGYVVVQTAIQAGIQEAGRSGICVVSAANTYPSGMLGDWAAIATGAGLSGPHCPLGRGTACRPGGTPSR